MEPILAFLIAFYVVAFMYDKTIDSQIKSDQALAEKLTEFKFFHSFQSRPKALSAALGFKFLGISTTLTIIGCTFAIMMYLGLGLGAYLLLR
ncbi:hypothetical protein [Colwellia ponticola]|uniref:Uncharacterized protein n=1 Tax=Colwellia ponticola TaxID=2304625 RepID=A0A8H2PJS8_9GAMM|nr:hypothetical protein [Colwellia ponticola]TMM44815.1 hypothetical protein FCS21_11140 [Colwellia ponticola]